jgi:hypothetical protein
VSVLEDITPVASRAELFKESPDERADDPGA